MKYSKVKKLLKEVDKDTLKELIEEYGKDLVHQYYDEGYSLSDMQEAYQGRYRSDEDFVEQLLTDCGDLSTLPYYIYIDCERIARDVMMDYFEINGHYFRSL